MISQLPQVKNQSKHPGANISVYPFMPMWLKTPCVQLSCSYKNFSRLHDRQPSNKPSVRSEQTIKKKSQCNSKTQQKHSVTLIHHFHS